MNVYVFDFETTGVDPKSCEIVQASAVDLATEEVIFNELCMPEVLISKEASDVHGWTKEKLELMYAQPEAEVMQRFVDKVGEPADILCGFNIDVFDSRILERHWPEMQVHGVDTFDLLRYVTRHHYLKGGYKLGDVYQHFLKNYDADAAHEATYDCVMVARLIKYFFPVASLPAEAALMRTPAEIPVMPFGKHSGKPIYKLPRSYMRYMLTLDLNPDITFTFREELKRRPGIGK